jgi:BlaI family transcriptional regulator, penicillinase repressor
MPRPESEHPTELELDILKVLWRESPLPVREVRKRLEQEADRPLAHSSVITMLNIMHRKGYLRRMRRGNAFLFAPEVAQHEVTGGMMQSLLNKAFDGSAKAMVLNLLNTAELDGKELAEIRKLIGRKAKEQRP